MAENINDKDGIANDSIDDGNTETKLAMNNNWWNSWISSAKTKSVSVLEAVKRDLDEISTTLRTEVSNAGSVINESLKLDEPESTANTVKKSLSSFFGQMSEVLVPTIVDDDTEIVLITNDSIVTLTGFQKHLAELQLNETTYLAAPDATLTDNFQRWLEVVDQDQFTQNQLAKHLSSSEILNDKYLKLVPEKVPHMEFWKRYLFKRALLEDALAHAENVERCAKQDDSVTASSTVGHCDEDATVEPCEIAQCDAELTSSDVVENTEFDGLKNTEIKWEAEISEEEQLRLLEEYEAEIQERERRKNVVAPGADNIQREIDDHSKNRKTSSTQKKGNINKAKTTSKHAQTTKKQSSEQINPVSTDALKVEQNHFNVNDATATEAGAASDESWEKDFDLSDH